MSSISSFLSSISSYYTEKGYWTLEIVEIVDVPGFYRTVCVNFGEFLEEKGLIPVDDSLLL